MRQVVRENLAQASERAAAKGVEGKQGRDGKLDAVEKEDQELAKFNLGRTMWMHLAVACTVFGALATIGSIVLESLQQQAPAEDPLALLTLEVREETGQRTGK